MEGRGLVLQLKAYEEIVLSIGQEIIKLQYFKSHHGNPSLRILADKEKVHIHRKRKEVEKCGY